ncbi:MAG: cytidine deaminase [Nocardioides sp.]
MSLAAEDAKLVTLARATRARTGAAEGAAIRDLDGRTYAAATVDMASLQVSAIAVAVSMAVASGSTGLEAVVLLTDEPTASDRDLAVIAEFAPSASVLVNP